MKLKFLSPLPMLEGLLRPDGTIVAECMNPYATRNPCHLEYHRANRERGRMSGQVRIRHRFLYYVSDYYDYLFVSPEELASILAESPFDIRVFEEDPGPLYGFVLGKR